MSSLFSPTPLTTVGRHLLPQRSGRSRPCYYGIFLALVWIGSLTSAGSANPPDKVAPSLRATLQRGAAGLIPVIIQMGRPVNADDTRQVQQVGGRVKATWTIISGLAADLPAPAVDRLAALGQ